MTPEEQEQIEEAIRQCVAELKWKQGDDLFLGGAIWGLYKAMTVLGKQEAAEEAMRQGAEDVKIPARLGRRIRARRAQV